MTTAEMRRRSVRVSHALLTVVGCALVAATWAAEPGQPKDAVAPLPDESMDELIEYLGSWEEDADWLVVESETPVPERGEDRSGKDSKEQTR